jgi:hypothetical protein
MGANSTLICSPSAEVGHFSAIEGRRFNAEIGITPRGASAFLLATVLESSLGRGIRPAPLACRGNSRIQQSVNFLKGALVKSFEHNKNQLPLLASNV